MSIQSRASKPGRLRLFMAVWSSHIGNLTAETPPTVDVSVRDVRCQNRSGFVLTLYGFILPLLGKVFKRKPDPV